MCSLFLTLILTLAYMETVYHVSVAGMRGIDPLLLIPLIFVLAGLEFLLISIGKQAVNRVLVWIVQLIHFLLFASQLVYMQVFTQPLLFAAVVNAGENAVKNYWRELFHAIGKNMVSLLFLAVPLFVTGFVLHRKRELFRSREEDVVKKTHLWNRIAGAVSLGTGAAVVWVALFIGYQAGYPFYQDYQGFYDPGYVARTFGVLASVQRDCMGDLLPEAELQISSAVTLNPVSMTAGTDETVPQVAMEICFGMQASREADLELTGNTDTSPQTLNVNFERLNSLAADKALQKLVSYMETRTPTNKNEYTGMFRGYNLIYLTAEGFSPYAVSEELTPTLYRLSHSGFVAENYYVPLWATSTSDGEYVNLMGQIPSGQFSMRKTSEYEQPYALPAYFAAEGVKSFAYHNNTLDYYDRHLSHPNLGYDFKTSKPGDLEGPEWESMIFEMENANLWPSSDLDMIKATLPEYIEEDRFHVYYMTVSGHMYYTFTGNSMSRKNKDAVADLPYSDEGKAYIACNLELDKALEYLIDELEAAGKLDDTVIVLSADHYPYGMDLKNYEELAGMELEDSLELYRNTLILWNSRIQDPIVIEKPCGAMDLLPTIYNLFGFSYDSRLFAGTDMLSDSPGLVVFSDRSFIAEDMSYNKVTGEAVSPTQEPLDEEYVTQRKQDVRQLYNYSNGILDLDFFHYVEQAVE
ncbi:MAG: sulfatase-like hydrolase/transferase [Eubacterium sp.]|nr:sulfatase-like hydrolase/transferase [Eubacterium sp.]